MTKERGELAFAEALADDDGAGWNLLSESKKSDWARLERAVRNAALEEAAVWHDNEAARITALLGEARAEGVGRAMENVIDYHETDAAILRAMKEPEA